MAMMVLARCKDYNGHKNVLFMMDSSDFRFTHPKFKSNYEVLDRNPSYDGKKRILSTVKGQYRVYEDWSLKKI